MTQPTKHARILWAASALSALLLAGCAAGLDCADCHLHGDPGPKFAMEPLRYNDLFGRDWVAGVSVDGVTATAHYPPETARK